MSRAARNTASEQFCASRIIPLYEQYYERVLGRTNVDQLKPQPASAAG